MKPPMTAAVDTIAANAQHAQALAGVPKRPSFLPHDPPKGVVWPMPCCCLHLFLPEVEEPGGIVIPPGRYGNGNYLS